MLVNTNTPSAVGTYTETITVGLSTYPTVPKSVITFKVNITCVVKTLTWTTAPSATVKVYNYLTY